MKAVCSAFTCPSPVNLHVTVNHEAGKAAWAEAVCAKGRRDDAPRDGARRCEVQPMSDDCFHETHYLADCQYHDAGHLNARRRLHARFCSNAEPWYRWVFDRVLRAGGNAILEAGAGSGQLWHENAERIPREWNTVLTDLSPGMIRDARTHLVERGLDPGMLVAGVEALPFEDRRFDVALANHMLYHVADLERALGEIHRVLRPGGTLFAATNGAGHMHELIEWGRKLGAAEWVGFREAELSFSVENGEAILSRWFAEVRFERYEDYLLVTEVEPLVDYILSMVPDPAESEKEGRLWRDFLAEELAKDEIILITKDTGLYTAVRT